MIKKCKQCLEEKDISEFYRYTKDSTKYRAICKVCLRKIERERMRIRYAEGKIKPNRDSVEYVRKMNLIARARFPEKYKARHTYANAIAAGKLKRQPCEICGSEKVHGHHLDYSKPLEVVWLCSKHHGEAHRKENALQALK